MREKNRILEVIVDHLSGIEHMTHSLNSQEVWTGMFNQTLYPNG
ncbi:hypothetical protein [Cytobacillus gottheilii]|nr:hypothetical protein [Cytobacillus gottheilii]